MIYSVGQKIKKGKMLNLNTLTCVLTSKKLNHFSIKLSLRTKTFILCLSEFDSGESISSGVSSNASVFISHFSPFKEYDTCKDGKQ